MRTKRLVERTQNYQAIQNESKPCTDGCTSLMSRGCLQLLVSGQFLTGGRRPQATSASSCFASGPQRCSDCSCLFSPLFSAYFSSEAAGHRLRALAAMGRFLGWAAQQEWRKCVTVTSGSSGSAKPAMTLGRDPWCSILAILTVLRDITCRLQVVTA